MPEEKLTIIFKDVVIKGAADDGTLSFNAEFGGDAIIELDMDVLDALIADFEEEAAAA